MVNICFYFQVHQPYRLRHYSIFDIGHNHNYFDDDKNKEVFLRVARKCYLPMNKLLLKLLNDYPDFKVTFSFSGMILEQMQKYSPEILESFLKLVDTKKVEILSETYYHSLSSLYSKQEFLNQIAMHKSLIEKLFSYKPKIFRNTELIYSNQIASWINDLGYKGILAEGADHILEWRSPNYVYKPVNSEIALLLKNYKLSDDIAFRFSNKQWQEFPLTADKYAAWLSSLSNQSHSVNLFMDYETFGEHQWEDTGIFQFMENLPKFLNQDPNNKFVTPSEIINRFQPIAQLDIHHIISWADIERDTSAWLGNNMQREAIKALYNISENILNTQDLELIEDWRKLQTSDHFYYMCTKWFNDGDVHKYFNPYESPYEAFISFMNVLQDINLRIKEKEVANEPTKRSEAISKQRPE